MNVTLSIVTAPSSAEKEKPRRIYTCTPFAFPANAPFFARDTGLIHTQLRAMGVESRCVLALPQDPRDLPDPEGRVIRTTLQNMEDPNWWRSHELDGVFLYSWGAPRYRKVARAIHKAGIRLAIHLDMGSLPRYWNQTLPLHRRLYQALRETGVNIFRACHLRYADVITAPRVVYQDMKKTFFYKKIANKVRVWPCPVAPHFNYNNETKHPHITCVGRWDDVHIKRTGYLMKALEHLTRLHPETQVEVCGGIPNCMEEWHKNLPQQIRENIHLKGYTPNQEIPNILKSAQISVCTSFSEGTCIAMGEALCCGCSIIVANRPCFLPAVMDYALMPGCGRIPENDTPEAMATALLQELESWQRGERDAQNIAQTAHNLFHIAHHLRSIFNLPADEQG